MTTIIISITPSQSPDHQHYSPPLFSFLCLYLPLPTPRQCRFSLTFSSHRFIGLPVRLPLEFPLNTFFTALLSIIRCYAVSPNSISFNLKTHGYTFVIRVYCARKQFRINLNTYNSCAWHFYNTYQLLTRLKNGRKPRVTRCSYNRVQP